MHRDKILVVPDLHGNLHHLKWVVETFPAHFYVFLGDLIDRGPESASVVQKVRALVDFDRAELCLGNHEDLAIRGILDGQNEVFYVWIANGGLATLRSYGLQQLRDFRGTELEEDLQWIREHALPYVMHHHALIAHAARPRLGHTPDGDLMVIGDHHIWDRPTLHDLQPLPAGAYDSVHGHTPFAHPIVLNNDAYFLDLGGFHSDRFVVLELPSRTLHAYHQDMQVQHMTAGELMEDSHA
ncbi:metallophosphoesterase [Deinococcus roseus]|uniref:Phosphoprotein phosphatase n=1 Tax=Deinococcus roseus TaxID=392414 RepID=A0ABQ2D8R0_9DEIO|nr:metallophosphoesterase [Deinococcus roseus]GGJ50019.1 phosphoprotein phosphatase [Deinococcus roseus]